MNQLAAPADVLEILSQLASVVNAERDLSRAAEVAADAAIELTGAEFGALYYALADGAAQGVTLRALRGGAREHGPIAGAPRDPSALVRIFESRQIIHADDVGDAPPEVFARLPVRSFLAAPIVSRSGNIIGGVFLGHALKGAFGSREESAAKAIAAFAALPIDDAISSRVPNSQASDERVALNAGVGVDQTGEQFRLLVQGVIDYAIFMLDLNGRVSTWNAGAERIKGYTAEEIIGEHFSSFYTPEARASGEPERLLRRAREQGKAEMQGWRVRKDGSQFWASVVIDAVYDSSGVLRGFAKVTRDITEQRQAAEALETTRQALFQAQKMESIGQLAGGIAHDFNNMLAGIVGAMQLVERRIADKRYDDLEKYLSAALESANRASGLTSRLLAFGRRQPLDVKAVDVTRAIREMELILRRTMGENIAVNAVLADAPLHAMTDEIQLQSAILNLAINARDAMPKGGDLTISATPIRLAEGDLPGSDLAAGDYVLVRVKDTGEGMSAETLARAFDPFFTTKPIGAGTGLGLSMVYGFAKQTKGHAAIDSRPGAGAEVTLFLPAAEDTPQSDAEAAKARAETGSGEVVLIVEDEGLVRLLLLEVLDELGYRGHAAHDAPAALPLLDSDERIDLLITDVGLPGMNGRQLAEHARKRRPDLKILFVTGYAEDAAFRSGFLGPGMDLVSKPFDMDRLGEKIRQMLSE